MAKSTNAFMVEVYGTEELFYFGTKAEANAFCKAVDLMGGLISLYRKIRKGEKIGGNPYIFCTIDGPDYLLIRENEGRGKPVLPVKEKR